jgi:subtilisin-like proprotein convertase family protein
MPRARTIGRSVKGAPVYRTVPEILAGKNLSDPAQRAQAATEMAEAEDIRYRAVLAKAEELGIPVRVEGPGNKVSILHDIRPEGPLYRTTLNANAAISSAANLVYPAPYSLNGSTVKVGVWDAGSVRNTHREFSTTRVVNRNSTAAVDDHATHVAGTIGATGVTANAKGMAPSAAIDSWDWNSDYSEMTSSGASTATADATKIPISNHSYGYNATTADMGRYETEARDTDALLVNLPYYLPFWAAGNEQDFLTAKGGYQSITFNGLAKNLLTVGAVNDAVSGGVRSPSAGTMSSFSSWGPCDDGRIKPDVVANGVNLNSPISTGDTAYDTYSGTSMATPSAAGSAAMLAQLYRREFSGQLMRASMLKALLIHTADDSGTAGPDYKFGWGLINTKAAADVILAQKQYPATPKLIEGSIASAAAPQTYTFQWDGVSPIRATLCWTDPAGTAQTAQDSRTPNLRHNLDLKITAPDGTTLYQPFVMPFVGTWTDASMALPATRGKNNVDNVEQVYLASPVQAGTYTVTVSLDGSLTTSSQAYSIVLTGGAETQAPRIVSTGATLTAEGCGLGNGVPDPGEIVTAAFTLRNTGTLASSEVTATLLDQSGVTALTTAPQSFGSLAPGTSATRSFEFVANGECGGMISAVLQIRDGGEVVATIPHEFALGTVSTSASTHASATPITIRDNTTATPYPSTINVSGVAGPVSAVRVTLAGFSHTYPEDVDIVLVSPDGRKVALMGSVGGGNDAVNATLVFDDAATGTIGGTVTSGTYLPSGSVATMPAPAPSGPYAGSLSEFSGAQANGAWTLYVADAAAEDIGTISGGWSLEIITSEPVCCAENTPPVFAGIAPQTVVVGRPLNFAVTATDAVDGDPITMTASNLPPGATFNSTGGAGSFNWSAAQPAGSYSPTFYAADVDGTNSITVPITVQTNQPPVISPIGNQTVIVNGTLEFPVLAADPVGDDPITLSALNLPVGATFTATNGSGYFRWTNASPVGAYNVSFRASDVAGTTGEDIVVSVTEPPSFATYYENFDDTTVWGGGTTGYGLRTFSNDFDAPSGDYFTANGALRETTATLGGNAWRLGSETTGNLYVRYVTTNAITRFAMNLARWDNAPTPNFEIRYSTNSGATYTTLFATNGNWFAGDKIYKRYDSGAVDIAPGPGQEVFIELFRSTGERMLMDDFESDYDIPALPPVIAGPFEDTVSVGQEFFYVILADNAPTAFSATGLPPGLEFDASVGVIFGFPTTAGTYPVQITASNAFGEDTAELVITVIEGGGSGYVADFEDATKGGYASGTVSLNGIGWNLTEALIGDLANDFKNGLKSARLRGYAASGLTMLADKPGGLGSISFQYGRYGTDAQIEWIVEHSVDGGITWAESGRFTPGVTPATFNAVIGETRPARVRIRTEAGAASNRRANIDDILLTDFVPEPETPTISDIPDLTIDQDTVAGPLAIVIADEDTPANNLVLTASSRNTALLPDANIVFGGAGENRTVTITPVAGQSGQATIFVTVSDGVRTASDSFVLTVQPTVPDFGGWTETYPGLTDPSPGADPDGDGLANLVEYFMGLSPVDGAFDAGMAMDTATPGEISMDYRRSKRTQGVVGGMKWKNALTDTNWSAVGVVDEFVSDHGDYEMRRATAPVLPGEQRKFLRLEVEQQ